MNQVFAKPPSGPVARWDVRNPASEQGIKLRIRRSLAMHRTLAIVVFLLVLAATIVIGATRKPMYIAQTLMYVQPSTPKALTDLTPGQYDSSRYDSYIGQQLETIVRDDILANAIKRVPQGTWQNPGEPEQSAIARLRAGLKVQRVPSSFEVEISMKGPNPAVVTQMVNAVANSFLTNGRGDELAHGGEELQLLIADRQRILDALTKDREEQAKLSSRLGVADTSSENTGNPYDAQLQDLRRQVFAAREAHFVALSQLQGIIRGSSSPEAMNAMSDEVTSSDSGLSSLKASITQRRTELTAQMAGMTPLNPLYKQDQQELTRLDESLANLQQKLRGKASQQLISKWNLEATKTEAVLAQLEGQLAQQTSVAASAAPKLQRASDITADITRLQAHFTETDNAIHNLELQANSGGLAHISVPAVQPQSPAPSSKRIIYGAALPLALLCATFAAVFVNKLDRKVYIAEDLEEILHFPPMAVLPDSNDVSAAVMNQFLLRLAAGIDQAHREGNAKTFLFTAASPNLNTSRVIELLADKVLTLGYRVAVWNSATSQVALDATTKELMVDRHSYAGNEHGSSAVPSGKRQSLVFEKMMQSVESVDMLYIDAKPILASAETEFDTRLVDITVLIAGSGRTTRDELASSLALIRRISSQGVAAVLMDLRLVDANKEFRSAIRSAETEA